MSTDPLHFTHEDFPAIAPAAYAALVALGKAVDDSGLDKKLTELLKLRVSQINGCTFCTQFHLNNAHQLGIEQRKLDLVAVWCGAEETYSPRERAALAWAEDLTNHTGSDSVRENLPAHFTREEIIFLTAAIANINAWNRIAGGLRFPPPAAAG